MPRTVDHEQRRAEIVHGVWALIAAHGIEGVTMRRVAKAAGVSVGRIQHYFASREDLVRSSAQAMIDAAEAGYEASTDDPGEALAHAVQHAVPTTHAQRVGTRIWLSYVAASVADPELAALLAEAKRGQEEEVAQLLSRTEPGLTVVEARRRARELIGLADGLATRVVIGDLSSEDAMAVLQGRQAG